MITLLHEFTLTTVLVRLLLAVASAGAIGMDRSYKKREAGLHTYMLISLGAAMTIMIGIYEYEMLLTQWADAVQIVGMKYDVSRFGAQVLSGIGFLGAGTIITVAHQQKAGLTTATGLFATACMGMAAGAGYVECVAIAFVLIFVVVAMMQPLETGFKRRLRNITMCVEYRSVEDLAVVTEAINRCGAQIFDIEVERAASKSEKKPASAIFTIQLAKSNPSHSDMLSTIAELPCVESVQELIA